MNESTNTQLVKQKDTEINEIDKKKGSSLEYAEPLSEELEQTSR